MRTIYLDNNATTPLDPAVVEAMRPYFESRFGNPSSSHRLGREAAAALGEARSSVARCLGAAPRCIYFTRGGTESDNLAVLGRFAGRNSGRLVLSAVEHPAVELPARALEGRGIEVERVRVDARGRIDLEAFDRALERDADLVSVMLANNETGAIQPVPEVARRCRARGVVVHTDAVNAAGKVPIEVENLGIDFLSLSAHKFHGPKGVGVLYARDPSLVAPLLLGGGQEGGFCPGTENVSGAVGLAAALEIATRALSGSAPRMALLAERLASSLARLVPGFRLHVPEEPARLPNTLSALFPGQMSHDLAARLDSEGVCVSAGAACHAGSPKPSAVLLAMGLSREAAASTIRISLSRFTSEADVALALEVFRRVLSSPSD